MRNCNDNLIVRMTFQFGLLMVFFGMLREENRLAFSDQGIRSGCSIGANVKANGAGWKVLEKIISTSKSKAAIPEIS